MVKKRGTIVFWQIGVFLLLPLWLQAFNKDKIKIKLTYSKSESLYTSPGTLLYLADSAGAPLLYLGNLDVFQTFTTGNKMQWQGFVKEKYSDSLSFKNLGTPFPGVMNGVHVYCSKNKMYAVCSQNYDSKSASVAKWNGNEWIQTKSNYRLTPYKGLYPTNTGGEIKMYGSQSITHGNKSIAVPKTKIVYATLHKNSLFAFHYMNEDTDLNTITEHAFEKGKWQLKHEKAIPTEDASRDFIYCLITDSSGGAYMGSNMGNMWYYKNGDLQILRDRTLNPVSFQPYFFANYFNRIIAGEYPAGKIFYFENNDYKYYKNNIGFHPESGSKAREAQSFSIYSGMAHAGLWPWGEIWSSTLHPEFAEFKLSKRLFSAPEYSNEDAPYVNYIKGKTETYDNHLGQRVAYLYPANGKLYAVTSAKNNGVYETIAAHADSIPNLEEYTSVWEIAAPGNFSLPILVKRKSVIHLKITKNKVKVRQGFTCSKFRGDFEISALHQYLGNMQFADGAFGRSEYKISGKVKSLKKVP